VCGERLEVVKVFIYLFRGKVRKLGWTGGGGGGEYKNERQTLRATDLLMKIPNMNAKVLENIYEIIRVSKMLYGIELWGVKEEWEIIEGIQGRLCITS